MPPGGRSRKGCGGGYAAEPPRPWPDGREQPPQREMKVGYLMAGARPKGLLLPTPFRGHPRSPRQFLEPGSPAEVVREIISTAGKKCLGLRGLLLNTASDSLQAPVFLNKHCLLKISQTINFFLVASQNSF